jgi:intraflagellar transport protein 81
MNPKSFAPENKAFVYKVTAMELKEIVYILNKPPFDENFTMVTFDELQGKPLVALLEKIAKEIDPKPDYNLSEKTEENKALFSDLLAILSFPEATEEKFLDSCLAGEKQNVHRLLFYLLKNLEEFKQRAYLGQFLAPLDVPAEFLMDEEMRQLDSEFQELQKVFQNEHKELIDIKAKLPNKNRLDAEVAQLEAERDQLKIRISMFQQKTDTKDPAAASLLKELLAGTRALRKEQEEENALIEKLRSQKEAMDAAGRQILLSQQRYVDAQRAYGQEVSSADVGR